MERSYQAITHSGWSSEIPKQQWQVYRHVIDKALERGLHFSLGGAFAVATYTGRWRNTKDLDIYVAPKDRDAMVEVVTQAGMEDLYDREPYVRSWIYRAVQGDIIVDTIWAMANGSARVDQTWIMSGPEIEVNGVGLRVVPPEEIIWSKLYVLQKDRCDWPDIFNIFHYTGAHLLWEHLIDRLGKDDDLLSGILAVYAWLDPGQAQTLPEWLWDRLRVPRPQVYSSAAVVQRRANRLDTRPWFGPVVEQEEESESEDEQAEEAVPEAKDHFTDE